MTASTSRVRQRSRQIILKSDVSEDIQKLALDVLKANDEKNAKNRAESKAKKELHGKMVQDDVGHFTVEFKGRDHIVEIETPEKITIDVRKLATLVDEATFMEVISSTQAAVKRKCGSNVLATCATSTTQDARVKITEIKD